MSHGLPPSPLEYTQPERPRTNSGSAPPFIYGIAGFGYGVFLAVLSTLAAGIGHGTYVLMGISSSPLGILQNIPVSLLGTPILWTAVGVLLGMTARRAGWIAVLTILGSHYAALPIILTASSFGDWNYIPRVPELFMLGMFVYFVGQAGIWAVIFTALFSRRGR